ncbi:MAG: hypothetical protein GY722_23400 [bacterium]|nr:hypothetical protein [bacterium]
MRRSWTGIWLAVIVIAGGCGGGEMSMADYVDSVNEIATTASRQYQEFAASPQGRVLVAERDQLGEFTPQDLQAGLDRIGRIEHGILETAADINPPERVSEFHSFYFALSPYTAAREALSARAATAASWDELSATPEMAAYRSAVAEDKKACTDFAATIEERRGQAVFDPMPWFPSELTEVVEAVFACDEYPEHPEDMFRPMDSAP